MPRTLYSPKLSNDLVRALYQEGQHRRMPMTKLADLLLREALGITSSPLVVLPDPLPADNLGKVVA